MPSIDEAIAALPPGTQREIELRTKIMRLERENEELTAETLRLSILLTEQAKGPVTPDDLLFFETTPAMRERLRELSDTNRKDDYDRVVLLLLGDFARLLAYVAPLHDAVSRRCTQSVVTGN